MSMEQEFRIEVDLRPNGKQEVFKSIDAVQKWLDIEKEFWKWPENLRNKDNAAFHAINSLNNRINEIQDHIRNVREANNLSVQNNSKEQLKHRLEGLYKNRQLIHSSDPKAKPIKDYIDNNPIHAAYILRYYIEKDNAFSNSQQHLAGAVHALLFEFGVKGGRAK